jgi:hypothetical protein
MTEYIILKDCRYGQVYFEDESKYYDDIQQLIKRVAYWEGIEPSCIYPVIVNRG